MTTFRQYQPKSVFAVVLLSTALALTGCEQNNLGVVDFTNGVPAVQSPSIVPDSVNIDTLMPSGGLYTVTITVNVEASDPDGPPDLSNVIVEVLSPHASAAVVSQPLRDDGVAPDAEPGDGIFSGRINFDLVRAFAGRYRVRFTAQNQQGLRSNGIERTLFVTRNNSIPILSDLTAPDTILRPTSGFDLVLFTIAASDSDGHADINDVFFKRILPEPSSPISMFDDGNTLDTGDVLAGDGIFSRIVVIDSAARLGDQLFLFQARDKFGAESDSTLHTVTIIP